MYMRWLMFFGFKEHFNNYSVKSNNLWHNYLDD